MATLFIILSLGIIGTLMYSVYITRELNEERSRRYDAELWIDPVKVEQFYEDGGFEVLRKESE